MFPELNFDTTTEETIEVIPESGKTSFLFDFSKGDFVTVDGKLTKVRGLEAVKVWTEKILKTERFKFKVYESGDYGISLSDFVNSNYPLDFMKVEIERELKEALEKNPDINSVHSFSFERVKRDMICKFTVNTIYGRIGGEVKV